MTNLLTNNPSDQPDIEIEDELNLPADKGQENTIARRLALQILYEIDLANHPRGEVTATHLSRYALQAATTNHTVRLVNGVLDNVERLDMILQTVAQEWPLDEIAIVDRNILRIAVYEYAIINELPIGIVTDEAVRLARLFGSDASMRFVNGVLGNAFADVKRLQAMLTVEIPDELDSENDDEREDEA